ncbi:MAG: hypothetical protein WCG55_03955 [bacterium]
MEQFHSGYDVAEEKLSPEEKEHRRVEKRKKELKEKKKKKEKEKKEKEKIEKREKARVEGVRKGKESYARRVKEEKNLFKKSFRIGYMIGSWIAKRSTDRLDTSTLAHPNTEEEQVRFRHETTALAEDLDKDETDDRLKRKEEPVYEERDFVMEEIDRELRELGSEDHDIATMKPAEALNLVRIKELEQELKNENKKQKQITPDELSRELGTLRKLWEQSLSSLEETSSTERFSELLELTARAKSDPRIVVDYLKNEGNNLTSEERFFLEMSIELQKFKSKAKELIFQESTREGASAVSQKETKET